MKIWVSRTGFIILGLLFISAVNAAHVNIPGPSPRMRLAVGTLGATVDTVTFTVTSANAGSGVPITGIPTILVEVVTKRRGADGPATVTLSVDSSLDLSSGTDSIPIEEFGWNSTGVFAGGINFSGGPGQNLVTFTAGGGQTRREDTMTFYFDNVNVHPAGTYSGTITFSASML